jgi:uncharacterized protein YifN (PemK superfamily)
MPILHPVGAGTILLCDYSQGGFRPPEMVKRRPAIVISPRLPNRDNLCTVVPLSLTAPEKEMPYQCRLELAESLPHPFPSKVLWVKADMLATVCFSRLDLFRTERDQYGRRKYLHPKVNPEQLRAVRCAVLHALGLPSLTVHL